MVDTNTDLNLMAHDTDYLHGRLSCFTFTFWMKVNRWNDHTTTKRTGSKVCVCLCTILVSQKRDSVDGEGKYHSQNDHGDDDAADADS